MVIRRKVYEQIKHFVRDHSKEVGGILGALDSDITDTVPDTGLITECGCEYKPDICFLNKNIKRWQDEGISLQGIYHTHFHHVEMLSEDDCEYAKKILLAMPENVEYLYFPVVVLPEMELVPYKCRIFNGQLQVTREILVVK